MHIPYDDSITKQALQWTMQGLKVASLGVGGATAPGDIIQGR